MPRMELGRGSARPCPAAPHVRRSRRLGGHGARSAASTTCRARPFTSRGSQSDAVQRFQARAKDLASFTDAGLTYEDFVHLGLENVVKPEHIEEAAQRSPTTPNDE